MKPLVLISLQLQYPIQHGPYNFKLLRSYLIIMIEYPILRLNPTLIIEERSGAHVHLVVGLGFGIEVDFEISPTRKLLN